MSPALRRMEAKQRQRASRELACAVLARAARARLEELARVVTKGSERGKAER